MQFWIGFLYVKEEQPFGTPRSVYTLCCVPSISLSLPPPLYHSYLSEPLCFLPSHFYGLLPATLPLLIRMFIDVQEPRQCREPR